MVKWIRLNLSNFHEPSSIGTLLMQFMSSRNIIFCLVFIYISFFISCKLLVGRLVVLNTLLLLQNYIVRRQTIYTGSWNKCFSSCEFSPSPYIKELLIYGICYSLILYRLSQFIVNYYCKFSIFLLFTNYFCRNCYHN